MVLKRVLIIDALNIYLRAYISNPSIALNGEPIGGAFGFLKSLQKYCREMKPDHIVVCWDGPDGSRKRKTMHKGYKEGRSPVRLNRSVRIMSEEEEFRNKIWQQQRLITYLNCLPVSQIMIEKIEADDIISYVAQMQHFKDAQKVIISSDKDFYQLCNDKTVVYRPVQVEFINVKRLVETFGIHPNNFALARAICGDKSDNLDGVGGAGLKTVAKRFPFLSEANTHEIGTLLKACEDVENPLKVHHNILSGEEKIIRNYKMMQLYTPLVSVQASQKIKYAIKEMTPELNKTQCIGLMIEDGIGAYDWAEMFATMKRICLTTNES